MADEAVLPHLYEAPSTSPIATWSARRIGPWVHYSDAWLGLLSNPIQTDDMVKGAISALLYARFFFDWAWYQFVRKDVVS